MAEAHEVMLTVFACLSREPVLIQMQAGGALSLLQKCRTEVLGACMWGCVCAGSLPEIAHNQHLI